MELIKVKKDHEGNYYFQQLNNVIDIPHHGKVEFDYFFVSTFLKKRVQQKESI